MEQMKLIKTTYWAVFFLLLAIFTSVTLLSLYEILIIIPMLYFAKNTQWENKPKSWYVLLALTIWMILCNLINYPELVKPIKSIMKIKFWIFALLLFYPLKALISSDYFTIKKFRILLRVFMITLIAACVFGIIKYKTHLITNPIGRSKGFTQIMRYGYGSGLAATILFSLWVLFKNRLENIINSREIFVGLIFTVLGLWASGCRGAVLGLMAGVGVFICLRKPKITKYLVPITIIIGVLGTWLMIQSRALDHKASYDFMGIPIDASTSIRISQYQSGLYAMKDNPVTGLSIMQLSHHVEDIKQKYGLNHQDYAAHSHNIFIEMGASYGYPGFVLFILFFAFWAWEQWKTGGARRQIFFPAIIAIIILGQFENILDANNSSMIFFLYPLSFVKIPESFFSRG